MFASIEEALGLLEGREAERAARRQGALKTYVYAVRGAAPANGAAELVEAIDELGLSGADLKSDAQVSEAVARFQKELAAALDELRDARAAQEKADRELEALPFVHERQPELRRRAGLAAQAALQCESRVEVLRSSMSACVRKAPRIFASGIALTDPAPAPQTPQPAGPTPAVPTPADGDGPDPEAAPPPVAQAPDAPDQEPAGDVEQPSTD